MARIGWLYIYRQGYKKVKKKKINFNIYNITYFMFLKLYICLLISSRRSSSLALDFNEFK